MLVVVVDGRRLQLDLEREFWECLQDISVESKVPLGKLLSKIWTGHPRHLASAIRNHVLNYYMQKSGVNFRSTTISLTEDELPHNYH